MDKRFSLTPKEKQAFCQPISITAGREVRLEGLPIIVFNIYLAEVLLVHLEQAFPSIILRDQKASAIRLLESRFTIIYFLAIALTKISHMRRSLIRNKPRDLNQITPPTYISSDIACDCQLPGSCRVRRRAQMAQIWVTVPRLPYNALSSKKT